MGRRGARGRGALQGWLHWKQGVFMYDRQARSDARLTASLIRGGGLLGSIPGNGLLTTLLAAHSGLTQDVLY